MSFIQSQLGKKKLYLDGYFYIRDRISDKHIFWKCEEYKKKCKGRVIDKGNAFIKKGDHNHPGRPEKLEVRKALNEIKNLASTSAQTPQTIISQATRNLSERGLSLVPSVSCMKRTIRNVRSKDANHPGLPTSRQDLTLPADYCTTENGVRFLQYDSKGEDRFLIFMTPRCMQYLSEAETWFMDGTFQTVPSIFYQLFTIHVGIGQTVVPCLFALLPNKRSATYVNLFEKIKSLLVNFKVKRILSDFEMALIGSIKTCFPGVSHKGCFFHFSQCLYRKISALGLKSRYDTDPDFSTSLKRLSALAFVPKNVINRGFNLLCETETLPEEAQHFVEYFEETWVGRRGREPTFPHSMWNVNDVVWGEEALDGVDIPITNNVTESWHNSFKSLIDGQKPTIWRFLDALKRQQVITELKIAKEQSGDGDVRRKKYKDVKKRVGTVISRSDFGSDIVEVLTTVAYLL